MKKYTINLFEPHIKTIMEALEKHSVDPRLQDFIMLQVDMQKKSDELARLNISYDKAYSHYENQIQNVQQMRHHA